jgi:glutamine kinase
MLVYGFANKAETLRTLYGRLIFGKILPIHSFTVKEWRENYKKCLLSLNKCNCSNWIVRSSANNEDLASASNAGAFLSKLNVPTHGLALAVEEVINSYNEPNDNDSVLIQPMLKNVIRSGVVFSHDPNLLSPYRIFNWHEGDDTSYVTSGEGGRIWRMAAKSPYKVPEELIEAHQLLTELMEKFGAMPIDFEFAVTKEFGKKIIWLLQVRPLVLNGEVESEDDQQKRLKQVEQKINRGMQNHPFVMGKQAVYGVMPDWNPAEIIGLRPKPLALSLYRELITDSIWAYQRHNYGYRNLRSFPLMPHFYGLPYIDVRLSFNSFIPATLNEQLAEKLVNYYLNKILKEPMLHDKVEFEIVHSCYSLDLPNKLKDLKSSGFSEAECSLISSSLKELTKNIVDPVSGLWGRDAVKLHMLEARRKSLYESNANRIEKIYWLLEDGKRYGTLPFAGLARAGFIAVQILQSFVSVGIFSKSDYDDFMAGISTVSSELAKDRYTKNREEFLAKYGHLRPGTYDILSPRYDEQPDLYFDWSQTQENTIESPKKFSLTIKQMRELYDSIKEHALDLNPVELLDFIKKAIELREFAKFEFTKNISDLLTLVSELGFEYGFSRSEMAFCNIDVFKEMYIGVEDIGISISKSISIGKQRYAESLRLSLPPIISQTKDVWCYETQETLPNFITQNRASGGVADSMSNENLEGKIVCIPSADPGYDWIFARNIAGLITAWGGANSHMAIRASELGLPAVIGVGEEKYKRLKNCKKIMIDCATQRIEIIQ